MTSKNIRSGVKPAPFLLKPAVKDYLWGGTRLRDDFGKESERSPLAETWECSTHPDGPSTAASGVFCGMSLSQVIREHPEFLGTHPRSRGELPVLVKLIDAREALSIQVHPSDAYAREHENGQLGKSEMWYVLDAEPGAGVVYGLHHPVDRETLRRSVLAGTVEKHLQKVPVKKDDLFFVSAGTIHAIGAGALIAEIQENSNLTYRLYDYDRADRSGKKRELHVEKALSAANLEASTEPRQPLRILRYRRGYASELLCRCQYFEVYRILINTECRRELAAHRADSTSFRILLCVDGCGTAMLEGGETLPFFRGDCVFLPADCAEMRIHGRAQLLDVRG